MKQFWMNKLSKQIYYRQSEYFKNIFTLLSGTAIAQLILLAFTPLLTRLYGPESFGQYSLILSIVNILSVLATGRYELAILLPKNDEWGKHILKLGFIISIFFCLLLFVSILLLNFFFDDVFNFIAIGNIIFLVPFLVFINANLNSVIYWQNRKCRYKNISVNKISESITVTFTSIAFAFLSVFNGLVFSRFLGQLFALILYLKDLFKDGFLKQNFSKNKMYFVAKRYVNFPKFLIVAHFFNTAAFEAPALLINYYFGNTVLGFYGFANRVSTAPLSLMSVSLGSVFREEAAKQFSLTHECKKIYFKTFKIVTKVSILPFLLFFIFAPDVFKVIFGKEWITAGYYARYLTPMYFFQFISNPLSAMFMIAEKQKTDLVWQICLFVLNITILIVGANFLDIKQTLILFSGGYSIMYIINILLSYHYSKGNLN